MNLYQQKIEEVILHFKQKDIHLGFRRLVDCVLETANKIQYKNCITLNEWKENEKNEDEIISKCIAFLENLKNEKINIATDEGILVESVDLIKNYSRGNFKLDTINFKLHFGEVWGLVGENGNGKTTLLRILAQDLSSTSGEIIYHDSLKNLSLYNLRTRLTYLPQRTDTWYGSLQDNLKFAAIHYGISGEENELLVLMMIIRFGLYNYKDLNWSELSSGYKMRFELARTFLRQPKLLLLDEPLANLDILSQQIILEDLKYIAKSISRPLGIVLSSQQLFEVEKIADNILFLKNGSPVILNEIAKAESDKNIIIAELETTSDRNELEKALMQFNDCQISFNGGQFIIKIHDAENGFSGLLQTLLNANISIKYIRDISASSRRLFTN